MVPATHLLSDAEIAARILNAPPGSARDEEGELCRRFAPRIRRYGIRHLRDPHAAEDLMQRVLAAAIDGLRARRVQDAQAIAGYVLGICRTLSREDAREASHREGLLVRFASDLHPAAPPLPSVDTGKLRDCMRKLAERGRSILVMTFFAGWEAGEIAQELSMSAVNVRVVRHRAMRQVLDCMEAGDPR